MSTRFYFFGPPRAEQAGALLPLKLQKALALMAYLVVSGQPHTRDALSTLLWPEYDQSGGRGRLRRTLYELNNALTGNVLNVSSDVISLNPDADAWVDVEEFRSIVASCLPGKRSTAEHPAAALSAECLTRLEEAAALYTDDFLGGFSLPDAPEFEDWRFFLAEELRRSLDAVLVQLAETYSRRREWEPAIQFARRRLGLDPLHEPAHRLLMRLFASANHLASALRQYEQCVQVLKDELGAEPEEETKALYEAIRTRRFRPEPEMPQQGVPGAVLGDASPAERYVRREKVFAGGHAEVFRAEDSSSGQQVAIKRLNPQMLSSDPELVARFMREGQLLQQLNHPNIVRILDTIEEDGQQSIVMEYVAGGSLRALLDSEGALTHEQKLEIALQLADALVLAHESGVIHRDLKPDNVLLATDGTPRLTDFGLARLMHSDVRITQHGAFMGTLAYMSPEAINGERLDERSDIWSFGVMLYEMLAGVRPFAAEPMSSLLSSILHGPLPDISRTRPDISQPLAALLKRMLVRDREQRPASMRQVAAVLELIRDGRDASALLDQALPAPPAPRADEEHGLAAPTLPHSLPAPATPFIGRDAEMAAIDSFLADPQARLLTIQAPGGMGKTRLALAAADRLLGQPEQGPFGDGLYFASLAPLDSAGKIVQAIADSLGFAFESNVQASRTPEQQLFDFLRERRLLLILDNFEHLTEGASLVSDLLRAAPGLKIITTSRERLNLQEEHLLTLRGLEYPDAPEALSQPLADYPAVRLFAQAARRAQQGFVLAEENLATVGHICRLVEGMPLAVELAAAWLDVLPVTEIAEEVQRSLDFLETDRRNVPERQRSIRAVFETTWQRLNTNEQDAFARLSVFRGGFDRVAATEIGATTLRMLRRLVGRSLLQYDAGADRYQMHELLRHYGALKLQEVGQEREVHDRHSAYFCAAMQRYQGEIEGNNKLPALAAVERDIDNVYAAWKWALAQGELTRLDQAMHSLEHFFYWRSRIHEAEAFYRRAADQAAVTPPAPPAGETKRRRIVAALRARQANFGYLLQDWDAAREQFQASLDTFEELAATQQCDVRLETAYILMKMGDVTDDLAEARDRFAQSLALYEAAGDRWWAAGLRSHLGYVALASRDYDEARRWFEESLGLYQQLGDRWQFGWVMDGLSNVALYQQRLDEAEKLARESLALHREIGLRDRIADNLTTLSWIALAQGRNEAAQQFRQEAVLIWQELGLEDRINIPVGLEDQPFTPRWFSDIIDLRIGAVSDFPQSQDEEEAAQEAAEN